MHEACEKRADAIYWKKRHNLPQVAVCCGLRERVCLCEVVFFFFPFNFLFLGRRICLTSYLSNDAGSLIYQLFLLPAPGKSRRLSRLPGVVKATARVGGGESGMQRGRWSANSCRHGRHAKKAHSGLSTSCDTLADTKKLIPLSCTHVRSYTHASLIVVALRNGKLKWGEGRTDGPSSLHFSTPFFKMVGEETLRWARF